MPMPVSCTVEHDLVAVGPASTVMYPPGSVYLAALVSRLETTCARRSFVSVETELGGGEADLEVMASLLDERHGHLHALRHHVLEPQQSLLHLNLAARDPGDVEQIVHQPNQVLHLALDHLQRLPGVTVALQLQQLKGGHDGRERIAELVAEHGQEFVLGAIGFRSASAAFFCSVISSATKLKRGAPGLVRRTPPSPGTTGCPDGVGCSYSNCTGAPSGPLLGSSAPRANLFRRDERPPACCGPAGPAWCPSAGPEPDWRSASDRIAVRARPGP